MDNDEAQAYLSAAETFADLVGRIDSPALAGAGLGEWDLRSLIGHTSRSLVTVLTYFDQPAAVDEVASPEAYYVAAAQVKLDPADITERGRHAGTALGADPAGAVRDLVQQAGVKVAATEADAVITTIVGGMRAQAYLPTRTFELVVHGFDIATATGLDVDFAPEALADAMQLAARISVLSGRAPTLLAAMTGRRPLPEGFSIVF